jgi:GT2 family glycosyltransferase
MFNEEVDLCFRLRLAGWVVMFIPEATFVHVGGASTRLDWSAMYREQLRSHLRFLAKHEGPARAEQARRMLLLAMRLRAFVFRGTRRQDSREAANWLQSAEVEGLLSGPLQPGPR